MLTPAIFCTVCKLAHNKRERPSVGGSGLNFTPVRDNGIRTGITAHYLLGCAAVYAAIILSVLILMWLGLT